MTEQDAGKIVLSDRPQRFIELIRSNLMMRTRPLIRLKNWAINKVLRQMTNTASHSFLFSLLLVEVCHKYTHFGHSLSTQSKNQQNNCTDIRHKQPRILGTDSGL